MFGKSRKNKQIELLVIPEDYELNGLANKNSNIKEYILVETIKVVNRYICLFDYFLVKSYLPETQTLNPSTRASIIYLCASILILSRYFLF
jgi:hypothetical protein